MTGDDLHFSKPRLIFYVETLDHGKDRLESSTPVDQSYLYQVIDYGYQVRVKDQLGMPVATSDLLSRRNSYLDRRPSYASAKRIALGMLKDLGVING